MNTPLIFFFTKNNISIHEDIAFVKKQPPLAPFTKFPYHASDALYSSFLRTRLTAEKLTSDGRKIARAKESTLSYVTESS